MDQGLVMTILLAAVVGAIAGFVAGRLAGGRDGGDRVGPKTAFAIIFFLRDNHNALIAKVLPEIIRVRKNGDIDWTVVELAPLGGSGNITFKWIDHPDNPLEPDKNPLKTFNHDKPHKKVKGELKGSAPVGKKYRYQVQVDGEPVVDPDVEIMQ